MHFRLRTPMIMMAVLPPFIAWWCWPALRGYLFPPQPPVYSFDFATPVTPPQAPPPGYSFDFPILVTPPQAPPINAEK